MADHEVTGKIVGEARLELDSNKPSGVRWEITDLTPECSWECSCGKSLHNEEEAADHLEENA